MLLLQATIRDKKENPAGLRKQGFLPAVLYGEGVKDVLLKVGEKDFQKIFKEAGESSLVSLQTGDKKLDVLIHSLSKNPVSGRIEHVDFYHPSVRKKVSAEIPLVFIGEPPAVKKFNGVLIREMQALDVRGLAAKLPREIVVDVGGLENIEDKIYAGDLVLPEGVELAKHSNEIVALVVPMKEEKIEKEEKPAEEPATPVEAAASEQKEKE
ncbi:MAG: 50S ribosomal protein L25 [Patescibacteria group bacterium]|nr:50S ribosomal protein L25 [Patescibacteria group bacterium]